MITQDNLKELFKYDKDNGTFTRIKQSGKRGKIGDIAGTLKNDTGYVEIQINRKKYKAHRLAWLYMYGEFPDGDLDHINHKKDDNRIYNLRVVNDFINCRNRPMNKNNKSGIAGVSFHKSVKKWCATITVYYKQIHLGSFNTKAEAVAVRLEAEKIYGFHENHCKKRNLKWQVY